jgi:hypothetical protein
MLTAIRASVSGSGYKECRKSISVENAIKRLQRPEAIG